MENKQTAMDWLKKKCQDSLDREPEDANEKEIGYSMALKHIITLIDLEAKQMEREQIVNAWTDGFMSTGEGWNGEIPPECYGQVLDNEEYYNKMFNLK